jgi:hypothetical protein
LSAELIIIIVGVVLLLIAILDSITAKGSSPGLVNIKLRILLGIIGIMLIIYGGYSYGLVYPQSQIERAEVSNKTQIQYPIKKVQVISPVEGDSVKCRVLTMGVYPESHNKDIWVLLKPSNDKYYPQSDHTNTSYKRNGEWQVISRFGGDKGEVFDIIVYETDSAASQFFSATIQLWKDLLNYPGLEMEELPAGAIEVDRISVKLEDNCRGVF